MSDVTRILSAIEQGDVGAAEQLLPLAYDELRKLAAAELVKLRYFAGFSVESAADTLGLPRTTAYRHWTYARAWLISQVQRPG
jgi:DNA-directed RNA polymerase specialized sigma24 family protein